MNPFYHSIGLKLVCFLVISSMFIACSKDDCPDGRTYTYKYYNIKDNMDKQTFPYHFKDTQVWVNVNTTDTLHYILKDTVSSYDISVTSTTEGCPESNFKYSERLSYKFNCLEDTLFNYNYIYQSHLGLGFDPYLNFNKVEYYTYINTYDTVINYTKVYTKVRDREYFWENHENGIVRITVFSTKLYRIK